MIILQNKVTFNFWLKHARTLKTDSISTVWILVRNFISYTEKDTGLRSHFKVAFHIVCASDVSIFC